MQNMENHMIHHPALRKDLSVIHVENLDILLETAPKIEMSLCLKDLEVQAVKVVRVASHKDQEDLRLEGKYMP